MKKIILAAFVCGACLSHAHAQSLWGAEATVGQSDGQFDSDFTTSGDPNNLAMIGWTALSISDSSGSTTPGAAYWTWNLQGYSQGAYWGGTTPVGSPSQANGVAIFDSDFLDNGGVANAFGTGSSPSAQHGELISPRIDLTGYTDEKIMLKFFSFYRNFEISELAVAVSINDGFNWSPAIDYRYRQPETTESFIYLPLPEDTLAGVANLTQVRIKFIFNGDYYFALVDDVTIQVSDFIFTSNFDQPIAP